MTTYLIPSLVILALVIMNGLFVAAEFALIASRKSRVDKSAAEGSSLAKRVAATLASAQTKDRYIATSQLGITLASIGLGMYGEEAIAAWVLGPLEHTGLVSVALAHTIALVVAVALLTYLHVVIGEMVPKAVALGAPEKTALRLSAPMTLFGTVFRPLVWILNQIGNLCLRALGVPLAGHGRFYSVSELEQLVDESFEEGEVADRQHEIIDNIFSFAEREVGQLMTPRPRVVGLEIGASPEEALRLLDEGYSRLPVFERDLDHIVGILHVKDFIRAHLQGSSLNLRDTMRRAPRVPEHLPAENLLEAFKRLKVHMAVVMNEYGGTAGIVTLEDLLEEVVGEVQDEYDDEPAYLRELEPGVLAVRGDLLLTDLNRPYDLDLATDRAETVGGFIVDELGRPPVVGDTAAAEGLSMSVEAVDGLAISEAKIVLPPPEGVPLDP
ncbi:hemolysin family protein [soil metagenome]